MSKYKKCPFCHKAMILITYYFICTNLNHECSISNEQLFITDNYTGLQIFPNFMGGSIILNNDGNFKSVSRDIITLLKTHFYDGNLEYLMSFVQKYAIFS